MTAIKKQTDRGHPGENWTYTSFSEPELSARLSQMAGAGSQDRTDWVSFQPCLNPDQSTQDRFVLADWQLEGGAWSFRAVFDGHAGHETADHLVLTLPSSIQSLLASALANAKPATPSPDVISDLLVQAISALDDAIADEVLKLFPDGPDKLSDEEIRGIINDSESGGVNSSKVLRCMRGSTVLVTLIDPSAENVWVASLGDCQAVLGFKKPSGEWEASLLSSNHNGVNEIEVERIRKAHPGEEECILDDRVLGAIAVTRAVGDHLFKFPITYTQRVFMNSRPGFRFSRNSGDFLARNLTPPYLSNVADVQHVDIRSLNASEIFLIMCTDGLIDLYDDRDVNNLARRWVKVVAKQPEAGNSALYLLRQALGGDDSDNVSAMMTFELESRWIDDTTIIVQKLGDP